jgi:hypothetical protein
MLFSINQKSILEKAKKKIYLQSQITALCLMKN